MLIDNVSRAQLTEDTVVREPEIDSQRNFGGDGWSGDHRGLDPSPAAFSGGVAFCGDSVDVSELQRILCMKMEEANGEIIVIDTPPEAQKPFCGDPRDAAELQNILSRMMQDLDGEIIEIDPPSSCADSAMVAPPASTPFCDEFDETCGHDHHGPTSSKRRRVGDDIDGKVREATPDLRFESPSLSAIAMTEVEGGTFLCEGDRNIPDFADICLPLSFRSLGIPVPILRDGPFLAMSDGNPMLIPFGVRVVPVVKTSVLRGGKFVLHKKLQSRGGRLIGHFFSLLVSADGHAIVCDATQGFRRPLRPMDTSELIEDASISAFQIQDVRSFPADLVGSITTHGEDAEGGAFTMKKPSVCGMRGVGVNANGLGAMGDNEILAIATTPLTRCAWCDGSLACASRSVQAKCVDLIGVTDVEHLIKECCRRECRARHAYNFYWKGHSKINTLARGNVGPFLFVADNLCFSTRLLRNLASLRFRTALSLRGWVWSYSDTFGGQPARVAQSRLRQSLSDALVYFEAMLEFEAVGEHLKIAIGEELSKSSLALYERHLHLKVYPPSNPMDVKEVVGDGHVKVSMRCSVAPMKRAGAPKRNRAKPKASTNGWFMVVHPATLRVLSVEPQIEPEDKHVVTKCLTKVLAACPACNGFVYDRQCRYAPWARKQGSLSQLKYYAVDAFHAFKHNSRCQYCAKNDRKIARRFKGVNGSACESVFSWFRGYASILNSMKANNHYFYVLLFTKKHNLTMENDDKEHLPSIRKEHVRRKRRYACTPKTQATKAMRSVMKTRRVK